MTAPRIYDCSVRATLASGTATSETLTVSAASEDEAKKEAMRFYTSWLRLGIVTSFSMTSVSKRPALSERSLEESVDSHAQQAADFAMSAAACFARLDFEQGFKNLRMAERAAKGLKQNG